MLLEVSSEAWLTSFLVSFFSFHVLKSAASAALLFMPRYSQTVLSADAEIHFHDMLSHAGGYPVPRGSAGKRTHDLLSFGRITPSQFPFFHEPHRRKGLRLVSTGYGPTVVTILIGLSPPSSYARFFLLFAPRV